MYRLQTIQRALVPTITGCRHSPKSQHLKNTTCFRTFAELVLLFNEHDQQWVSNAVQDQASHAARGERWNCAVRVTHPSFQCYAVLRGKEDQEQSWPQVRPLHLNLFRISNRYGTRKYASVMVWREVVVHMPNTLLTMISIVSAVHSA